ncbi:Ribose-phosphate pyrophosphokinase [Candidatus Methanoperedenaceae archaeon GB50]|nr:Ribose-phosphate pyrophosphokinase [Candidatus Methanoperedenaceae archaeon GB50]
MKSEMKLFTGNSNFSLAQKIAAYLDLPLGKALVSTFSDGETRVEIGENVRGDDVFVIQSTCPPVDHNLMELLIMIDALKRASARRITAVIPYYGYARQDKKVKPRVPISAKLVADLITTAGANRVLSMDLHVGQIQGFFNIPVDHLFAAPVMLEYIKTHFKDHLTIVSPDAGGVERARAFAKRLEAGLAIIDKRRDAPNLAEAVNIIGDIEGRTVVILDDMVDTCLGPLTEAAHVLMEHGANNVYACCTHAVLSGPAIDRLINSPIKKLVVTDTIPLKKRAKDCGKIEVLSVAPLLGEAIKRIHEETSISTLFV